MGMPSAGARTIVVDGHRYRWSVSEDRDMWGVSLCVEREGAGGQRLLSGFLYRVRGGDDAGPRTLEVDPITPGVVRRIILRGLASGWRPEERGLAPLRIEPAEGG